MFLRSVRRVFASTGMVGAAVLVLAGSALPVQAADFIPIEVFGPITNFNGQCLEDPNGSTQPAVQGSPDVSVGHAARPGSVGLTAPHVSMASAIMESGVWKP